MLRWLWTLPLDHGQWTRIRELLDPSPTTDTTRGPTDEVPVETVEPTGPVEEDAATTPRPSPQDGTLIPPPVPQPIATFRTDETFEPTHRDAEITVTNLRDGVIIGGWNGNKDGVVDLVQRIEGLEEEDPLLIASDGTLGDEQTRSGIWLVHVPLDRLDDLE